MEPGGVLAFDLGELVCPYLCLQCLAFLFPSPSALDKLSDMLEQNEVTLAAPLGSSSHMFCCEVSTSTLEMLVCFILVL